MEKFFIIGVLLMGGFITVDSLQCYECYNCPASKLKDEHLVTCGATTTITTVVSPNGTDTTPPPGNPNTTTASTTTPVNPTTTPSPGPIEPGTTASTSAPVNNGTTIPTIVPVGPDTNSTNISSVDINRPVISTHLSQAFRVKRHVQPEIVELNSECICKREKCTCNKETEKTFPYADTTNITYVCAKTTIKVNGTDVVIRDCFQPKVAEQEICAYVEANLNATDCKTCTTDKCNSGNVLQHSIGILSLVLTLAVSNYI